MAGKWYSAMSTGILEVDCQHQNLDVVLSMAFSSSAAEAHNMLRTFAKGLSDHFRFEESLTLPNGLPFVDPDHEAEHRNIEKTVNETLSRVQESEPILDVIAMEFSRALMTHAANFDIPAAQQRLS